jgi:hypothetical protein
MRMRVAVTEDRDVIGVAIQKAIEATKSADVLAAPQRAFQEVPEDRAVSRETGRGLSAAAQP